MLWLMLGCVLGYQQEGELTTLSIEQTRSAHYFYYDKALRSSVRILSIDKDGEQAGHASGNYFKIGRHKFIVSAAHILEEGYTNVALDHHSKTKLHLVVLDIENDIAVFVPEKNLKSIRAVDYRTSKKLVLTGDTVVHAGYPADLDKSVFHGTVANCSDSNFMMQSFALPGSSGSVVFDNKGSVVGVLSAIKMGIHGYSPFPQLHAGLVFVNRLRQYDRYKLEELILQWKNLK
jgi:S1-C subfamily serine protease